MKFELVLQVHLHKIIDRNVWTRDSLVCIYAILLMKLASNSEQVKYSPKQQFFDGFAKDLVGLIDRVGDITVNKV